MMLSFCKLSIKMEWRRITCNNQGSPEWAFATYLPIQGRMHAIDNIIGQRDKLKLSILWNRNGGQSASVFQMWNLSKCMDENLIMAAHKQKNDELEWGDRITKAWKLGVVQFRGQILLVHISNGNTILNYQKKKKKLTYQDCFTKWTRKTLHLIHTD